MTTLPQQRPRRLSADEFAALPEVSDAHWELQEGAIVMSPRPAMAHQRRLGTLFTALTARCPDELVVLIEVDIDLQLVPAGRPGFVRAPDLVVAHRDAERRVETEGGLLRAGEVVLAVEVLSPGTRRTDTVVKHGEYADAGIPHYWMVDPSGAEVELTVAHLAGEFGYADESPVRGGFTADRPFPVSVDLTSLR